MLTLEQVKNLLNDPAISDREASEIRSHFYSLAEIVFEQWRKEKEAGKLPSHKPANHEAPASIKDSIAFGR